ncbi:hypothetical protein Gotur_023665 [Gossypium turneri]
MAGDQLAMPISISAPCLDISVMTTNPTNLNPEGMEALVAKDYIVNHFSKFASPSNVNEMTSPNSELDLF